MRTLLLINALIETLVGVIFLFYPGVGDLIPGLPAPLTGGALLLVKMYGVAAVTLGLFSWVLWRYTVRAAVWVAPGLLLFTLFHGGLAATQFLYNTDFRPGVLHAGLALAFAYFVFVKRSKPARA